MIYNIKIMNLYLKLLSGLLVFLWSFSIHNVVAQTPEQSYFEWADMPFSKEELSKRRANLIKNLKSQGISGLTIFPGRDGFSYGETFRQLDDFYYFTGLEIPNALLVLDVENEISTVFLPERDLRFENGSRPNDFPGRPLSTDSSLSEATGLGLISIAAFSELMENSAHTILINNGRQGPISFSPDGYIATFSPVQILLTALKTQHPHLKFKNIYGTIASIRMIKSEEEIKQLRKAADITVESIIHAAKGVSAGKDERYLEGLLEGKYKELGAHRLAFGSIIKSGPNSLWPWRILATHYNRRNRVMENGDLVVFDVGCEYNYYVSDIGRTFPVSGKFTDRQRAILNMEVEVADKIIDFLKPGITFNDVKKLQDEIIPDDAKPYMQVGLFFGHHLGLSTGDPNLSNATLQPGMIFTVEPWYYNHDEQISVFTEDMVLITKDGCEVLSKSLPRYPDELEALMK
jgi:Xaa-Pro aminopeptidase